MDSSFRWNDAGCRRPDRRIQQHQQPPTATATATTTPAARHWPAFAHARGCHPRQAGIHQTDVVVLTEVVTRRWLDSRLRGNDSLLPIISSSPAGDRRECRAERGRSHRRALSCHPRAGGDPSDRRGSPDGSRDATHGWIPAFAGMSLLPAISSSPSGDRSERRAERGRSPRPALSCHPRAGGDPSDRRGRRGSIGPTW
jgi:hypothetical protein